MLRRVWRRHASRRRPKLRILPTLVRLKLAFAWDRCGDHAGLVAEFYHDEAECRIELQAGIGPDRGRGGLPWFGDRVSDLRLVSRFCCGNGRGDRGDSQVIRHGGIDRSSRALLAPVICR
jgi:hypothetical protein